MFRSTGPFDKLLDKATSHLLLEPDWQTIIQICDVIRQNDVQPKYALQAIHKKLNSKNPHVAMFGLQVLESIVKNCGIGIHEELTSKANCELLRELSKSSPHENVRSKILELIQAWSYAFRKSTKYRALKDTMNIMKTEGYKFPVLRETDAMFSADSAPEWADGEVCHRCRTAFSLIQRKHHCRNCGQVFCGQCSAKTTTLPKFGIEKDVRVCDACFEQITKPSAVASEKQVSDSDLPAEYLSSSLAQQTQVPPRKTEEELREEEELQLALALSQSEAEAKEKNKTIKTSTSSAYSTPQHIADRSPSPIEEATNPELAHYLNRTYWETRQSDITENERPSAPVPLSSNDASDRNSKALQENGVDDPEMHEFVNTLKSQVEIFINRMKSNSSRGRSIANDSSVQTLFMNITAMHSKLLRFIQQHDDSRLHYEGLQDKLTQVKDARAALDALREEHREKMRKHAEEAERQRQLQMAHKLDIMRKKKQEYLQYQRQLALQRIQEQEREMQMRQEQQKQQYLMSGQQYSFIGSPVHGQQPNPAFHNYPYRPTMPMMPPQQQQQPPPQMGNMPQQQQQPPPQMGNMPQQQQPPPQMGNMPQQQPMNLPPSSNMAPALPQQQQQQQQPPPQQSINNMPPNMPGQQMMRMSQGMPIMHQQPIMSTGAPPQQTGQAFQAPVAPPSTPQQHTPKVEEGATAELISFD